MLGGLSYALANWAWLAGGASATRRYHAAVRDPARAQEQLLFDLLRANADCHYGRRHAFDAIRTVPEFQDRVPVVRYEDLEPEIERIKRGEAGVLTSEPVLMLEKSGGSTGPGKYVPYTAGLKREFSRAVAPWTSDLLLRRPRLRGAGSYWSVSPLAAERERTEGGLPVGFEEDTEYFGPLERRVLERLILTPPELPRVPDIEASRHVTLLFLLRTPRLGFLSVWHPSFLTLLLDHLDAHADCLITGLERGKVDPPTGIPADLRRGLEARLGAHPQRAAALRRLLQQDRWRPTELWPHLTLVSCWTDAAAEQPARELQRRLPGVELQGKGLLATEGVLSIPLLGHPGAALAVTSHFLEFADPNHPAARPRLAHELEDGRLYTVLLTTGGGLYRYALGDRVQVVGRIHQTPLIRFPGKSELVSDLAGEKLHEEWVRTLLQQLCAEVGLEPRFAMLAPELTTPPAYHLFIEAPGAPDDALETLAARLETRLCEGHHYAYCRRLGQLGPVRAVRVQDAWQRYLHHCTTLGQRAGDIKPTALSRRTGWDEVFRRD